MREVFRAAEAQQAVVRAGGTPAVDEEARGRALVLDVVKTEAREPRQVRLIRGRFWIYRYEAEERLPAADGRRLTLDLPPVDDSIEDGKDYLVAEITFTMPIDGDGPVTWKALFEPVTRSVLYLRAMVSDLTGRVFDLDPVTKTANTALSSTSDNAALDPHRDTVTLMNLDPPSNGTQTLRGTFGEVREVEGEVVEAPANPAGTDFNFAYVKVKNRGTKTAHDVVVSGYHTKPGAGLLWPNDFEPLDTPRVVVGAPAGDSAEEVTVGPFEWTPDVNAFGHDCLLMIARATGDASNVDTFTAGEVIPEWRLVPNDNNIGQRNVHPVPGNPAGLVEALKNVAIWVRNPEPRRAKVTFDVRLPRALADAGRRLDLAGVDQDGLDLKPGGRRRRVKLQLVEGGAWDPGAIGVEDRDVRIDVRAGGNLVGGMTYRLDPELQHPHNRHD